MYTFIGAPNPTPALNLPTSEQYKTRTVTGIYSSLKFDKQINSVVRSSFFQLRLLANC